uniref:Alternative protein PPARA n=1 Tax=Homo sapiens TaxID=9606 RepID=L8E859_HUMAN|nr:alternative protein PPARA [Homo sapiens]
MQMPPGEHAHSSPPMDAMALGSFQSRFLWSPQLFEGVTANQPPF